MAGRIQRVFNRYAARHLSLDIRGPALLDAAGRQIGRIETVSLRNGRLIVEGDCQADHLTLDLAGRRRLAPGRSLAGSHHFRLDLPFAAAPAVLSYTLTSASSEAKPGAKPGEKPGSSQTFSQPLPQFTALQLQLARLALWPRFALASLAGLPSAYRWLRYHDMSARARIKKLLGLGAMVEERRLDAASLPPHPPALPRPELPQGQTPLTLVLPVYQAFDLLPEVLDRISRHTDLPWRLILVEDASPDLRIRPFLREWTARCDRTAGCGGVTLLENASNLGFIGSVNLALTMATDLGGGGPVILLNSDAFVPAGWASRLVAPMLADPAVASVTPMSNDAELMSIPVICAPTALLPGAVDVLDRAAQLLEPDLAEAPTGVGFCMALNPRFLAQVPQLDPVFGRGYGEEVDWCQKTRALGGRHVCLTNLFVEHRGGTSFGSEAKQELLRRNGGLISARYPQFDTEVQRFISDEPLLTARLTLALAWAGSLGQRLPIYLAHALGGGAEHYLRRRIREDLGRIGAAVVLRVGGEYRWEILLHSPAGVTRGATNDQALMMRLLRLLPQRLVVYSCGVGDPDPIELPQILLEIAADQPIEVLIHDYLSVSPSYTLLDLDGSFQGAPLPGQEGRGHSFLRPNGQRVTLAEWQAAWRPLLQRAGHIAVFSQASRSLMLAAYPETAAKLQLLPHHIPPSPPSQPRRPARSGQRLVIGVLGNIGPHKGAGLLVALSRILARDRGTNRRADLVLIGNIDPSYNLAPPAKLHGDYEPAQIPGLALRYGISCWLIPSIWSETFSYTTHEALATGLPVICFDLGAQAEAVRRAMAAGAPGAVLPLQDGRADAMSVLAAAQRLVVTE